MFIFIYMLIKNTAFYHPGNIQTNKEQMGDGIVFQNIPPTSITSQTSDAEAMATLSLKATLSLTDYIQQLRAAGCWERSTNDDKNKCFIAPIKKLYFQAGPAQRP